MCQASPNEQDSPMISSVSPFLIVGDLQRSIDFYAEQLGFSVAFQTPEKSPFFAIVVRGGASVHLKCVGVESCPNRSRHPDARWDAFFSTADPDALFEELSGREVEFHESLRDTDDGLRGFEVEDPDSHVLFFGRPQ